MPETGKPFQRQATIGERSAINADTRSVELAFSSESVVRRWFGDEILDHRKESIDLGRLERGAPLLLNHDPDRQIGVVERAWVDDDKVARAVVRFSKQGLGAEVFEDVKDGIRSLVSVSYSVEKWEREKGGDEEVETHRATNWTPLEISIVAVPADTNVGVGRSKEPAPEPEQTTNRKMPEENTPSPAPIAPKVETIVDKRAEKIAALGKEFGATSDAVRFITEGKSVDEFTKHLLAKRSADPVKPAPANPEVKLDAKERRQYSLLRACRTFLDKGAFDGFEKEVSDECAKRAGSEASGLIVPWDALGQRDLNVTTAADGGNTVPTVHAGFIDLLRNKMLMRELGATVLPGLTSNIDIPKLTGGATAEWVAEEAAPSAADAQFGQVPLRPKTVSALTGYTKQLLTQSGLAVENLVKSDLATVLALAIDSAIINGSGAGGQPTGILNTAGIGSVTSSGSVAWSHIVDLETEVDTDNALAGSLAYVMDVAEKGALKKTEVVSGVGEFIIGRDKEINGYRYGSTKQCPANTILFGNFADVIVGMFGPGLDLVVDPYTNAQKRAVRVVASIMADVAIRHAESFAAITDA